MYLSSEVHLWRCRRPGGEKTIIRTGVSPWQPHAHGLSRSGEQGIALNLAADTPLLTTLHPHLTAVRRGRYPTVVTKMACAPLPAAVRHTLPPLGRTGESASQTMLRNTSVALIPEHLPTWLLRRHSRRSSLSPLSYHSLSALTRAEASSKLRDA